MPGFVEDEQTAAVRRGDVETYRVGTECGRDVARRIEASRRVETDDMTEHGRIRAGRGQQRRDRSLRVGGGFPGRGEKYARRDRLRVFIDRKVFGFGQPALHRLADAVAVDLGRDQDRVSHVVDP